MGTAEVPAVAPSRFGKYTLVERLGRGGMAEVWKAKILGPAGFQRTLVVKRILPHLVEDPHFVDMFMAEARLSARLNHVNIVQVYELGDVNGEFFLAMEYVRGRDLVSCMRALIPRGVPEPGFGAYVMRETCRALAYAHALSDDNGRPLRLIHRDVSPSNVMLSFDGAVKLLDFGIAKALAETAENKTQTGTLKGKFGYMSPEQVEGRPFDHRADIFAAGVMLHEILCGRRLFKGASDLQTIAMVREAKVEAPSLINPQVTPELDRICLRALTREAELRYQSCDEMANDLDQAVHPLKWGPERLKQSLRDLFPDEPSNSASIRMVPDEPPPKSNLTSGAQLRGSRSGRLWLYAAGVAVVIGGAALGVTLLGSKPAPVPLPAPVAVAPPPPPAPAVSREVRVRVHTVPDGVDVFMDSEKESRGKTPLLLMVPRSEVARKLHLTAPGFTPATLDITPDSDVTVQHQLAALARPAPPVHHSKKPSSSSRKSDKPSSSPAPDLKKGDVVDPFAR